MLKSVHLLKLCGDEYSTYEPRAICSRDYVRALCGRNLLPMVYIA